LGNNAVVDAIALGHNQRASFDVSAQEYIHTSILPCSPVTSDGVPDSPSVLSKIQDVFISTDRLGDLAALVKKHIIQKIAGGTAEAAETSSSVPATAAGSSRSEQPRPTGEAPRVPPATEPIPAYNPTAPSVPATSPRVPAAGEEPPGFEDEYDIYRQPGHQPGQQGQPRNPLAIGGDDLYPQGLGPNDPFRPTLGPGGLRQPGSGGGMHPTFDDPLFGGQGGQPGGPQGGPQIPPGARYDPTFPDDPFGGPGGWPGAGHRGPGGSGGGFGGFGGRDFI
jgi:PI31 proteasome regulator/PI31 proteasome regulator N-terminal